MQSKTLKAGVLRGLRAFIGTFAAVVLQAWTTEGALAITSLWHAFQNNWDGAAGTGLFAAIIALGWRTLLDPSSVPSLKDPDQQP